jgi:hypothetical protein
MLPFYVSKDRVKHGVLVGPLLQYAFDTVILTMVLVPCIEGKEEEENRRRGKGSRFFCG